MTQPLYEEVLITSKTHLRKLARNRTIMVDASPKTMVRAEIIHVPTTLRGGMMMLDVAQENNGQLIAAPNKWAIFLYLKIPDHPDALA